LRKGIAPLQVFVEQVTGAAEEAEGILRHLLIFQGRIGRKPVAVERFDPLCNGGHDGLFSER
jgi:hypothetical protein